MSSYQLLNDSLNQLSKVEFFFIFVRVIQVFDEFGNGLCIGVWLKLKAFLHLRVYHITMFLVCDS